MNPSHTSISEPLGPVRVPRAALRDVSGFHFDGDGFAPAELLIGDGGSIECLRPLDATSVGEWIALPPLIEAHTHIDKAFLRARAPNLAHDFQGARSAIEKDRAAGWSYDDAYTRMQRALQLAYGHGVVGLRTHIDSQPDRLQPCWDVYADLRREWEGRLQLQAVASLASAKLHGAHGERLGLLLAEHEALLGPVFYVDAELQTNVEHAFDLAERYGLDLDVHIDENDHGRADGLRAVLDRLDRKPFKGRVNLSHLCSLGLCESQEITLLAERMAAHGLTVIGLPVANLHLQDRDRGDTPHWRGLTPINALARADVEVALGGDNAQDMFVPWGALDPLAVLRDGMLAAHLDQPLGDALARVSRIAAGICGWPELGYISAGSAADLTLIRSHDPYAAICGDYHERLTVRGGQVVASRRYALHL